MRAVLMAGVGAVAALSLAACGDSTEEMGDQLEADVIAAVKADDYFAPEGEVEGDVDALHQCIGEYTYAYGEVGSLRDYVDGTIGYTDIIYLIDESLTQEEWDAQLEQLSVDCLEESGFDTGA